jgi:hypothetical protein
MASTTQDRLYQTFVGVSRQQDANTGGTIDSGEEIAAALSETVQQLGELQGGSAAQAAGSGAVPAASTTGGSSGTAAAGTTSDGGSSVESIVTTVLESGLGMVPLIVGLMGLFGGGGTPAPPPLVKYAMPDPIYFEGADTGSDVSGADYDQMGMPRTYGAAPDGTSAQASGTAVAGSSGSSGAPSGPIAAAAPQITVNVQAMDSQSFLDHSSEIAQAVRDAMLNCNSINDVVNDL